jgi:hypothetical protein
LVFSLAIWRFNFQLLPNQLTGESLIRATPSARLTPTCPSTDRGCNDRYNEQKKCDDAIFSEHDRSLSGFSAAREN